MRVDPISPPFSPARWPLTGQDANSRRRSHARVMVIPQNVNNESSKLVHDNSKSQEVSSAVVDILWIVCSTSSRLWRLAGVVWRWFTHCSRRLLQCKRPPAKLAWLSRAASLCMAALQASESNYVCARYRSYRWLLSYRALPSRAIHPLSRQSCPTSRMTRQWKLFSFLKKKSPNWLWVAELPEYTNFIISRIECSDISDKKCGWTFSLQINDWCFGGENVKFKRTQIW